MNGYVGNVEQPLKGMMMNSKKIDLSAFAGVIDDSVIRKTFYNDNDLMILCCLIYEQEATSIPQLHKKFNKLRGKNYTRPWVYTKLNKIDTF